jgi:hypothetical protein
MSVFLRYVVIIAVAMSSVLASMPVAAGGSSQRVSIDSFKMQGVDYTLVVSPIPSHGVVDDPYMASCKRFEVRGTYQWLKGAIFGQDAPLSRKAHLEALEYLRQAFETKQPVDFGWVGTGFVRVDPANPCVVKSRALWKVDDERGTQVLSFYVSTNARSSDCADSRGCSGGECDCQRRHKVEISRAGERQGESNIRVSHVMRHTVLVHLA